MRICIGRHFQFEASHQLPQEHECYGKCRHLHGHRYELEVQIEGELNPRGWICDFAELKDIVHRHVIDKFDHQHLNHFFEIPTAEHIALWIFQTLQKALRDKEYQLVKIRLYETEKNYAEVCALNSE
ncbi:MAG: 6-carboxytetrahydropterin synthase QueD [Planctomycetota bacterium]|nr:MAG: 6-carboxytetrahydropterin synthase QueD [Planctomycetota bacterium]